RSSSNLPAVSPRFSTATADSARAATSFTSATRAFLSSSLSAITCSWYLLDETDRDLSIPIHLQPRCPFARSVWLHRLRRKLRSRLTAPSPPTVFDEWLSPPHQKSIPLNLKTHSGSEPTSTWMPGPIVVDKVSFLMKMPFDDAGRCLRISRI